MILLRKPGFRLGENLRGDIRASFFPDLKFLELEKDRVELKVLVLTTNDP